MGFFDFIIRLGIAFVSFVSPVTGFALSLVDSFISGNNILKTLALGYLSNVLHDSAALLLDIGLAAVEELAPTWKESEYAAGLVVPNNQLTVPCSGCRRTTNDYITREEYGRQNYYCPVCTKGSIHKSAQGKDKMVLYPDTIMDFHSDLRRQNDRELSPEEIVMQRRKELRKIYAFLNNNLPSDLNRSARNFSRSQEYLNDWFGLVFDAVRIVGELDAILGEEFSSKVASSQRRVNTGHEYPGGLDALVGNLRGLVYSYAVRAGAIA